jgi:lysophospholipase L1-like esterase
MVLYFSARRFFSVCALLVALLVAATLFFSAEPARAFNRTSVHQSTPMSKPGWVGAWTASSQAASPLISSFFPTDLAAHGFDDQTVRNILFTSIGGTEVRIRLSNTFGTQAVTIGRATIGAELSGAQLVPNTVKVVTFSGHTGVTIPLGAEVVSDPIPLAVQPFENLAVSLYLPNETGPATHHADAQQINFVAAGNHATDSTDTAFTTQTQSWYFLDAVDVLAWNSSVGAIVALGDSITDGVGSEVNANDRWPNLLARRLVAQFGDQAPSVLDAGIAGNRVLNSSACFGQSALTRFNRDVFDQTDVRAVILLEGINDIRFSNATNAAYNGCYTPNTDVSAQQIIQGYKQIIAQVHAHGLKIFAATLTPSANETLLPVPPESQQKWQAANAFLRSSNAFDGVFDFAKATANPFDSLIFNPGYDSGDGLHPNDAGYQAMVNVIDLGELRKK